MEEKKTKFSFQNTRVMLTYKTHIDKTEMIKFITDLGPEVVFCRCAHETGDEHHNYLHTHVLVKWKGRVKTQNERFFDYKEIHPHIKPITTNTHWANGLRYLAKEDKENADLLVEPEKKISVDRIWDCKNIKEALDNNMTKFSDVSGIVQLYKLREYACEENKITPRLWQVVAAKFIDENKDDRSIIWLWETKGNIGKSFLVSYIEQKYGEQKCLVLTDFGRLTDTANIVQQKLEAGWSCDYVLIDLKRSMRERDSIYPVLEAFKDRRFTNTKYMGGTLRLRKCPVVVVVANWLPQFNALSLDRWKIIELTPQVLGDFESANWTKYVKTDFDF